MKLAEKLEYIIFNFTDKNLHNNPQDLAFIYDTTVREIIRQDVRSVLRELPDDATLFVTSDHGFAPVPKNPLLIDGDVIAAPVDVNYRVVRTRKRIPDSVRALSMAECFVPMAVFGPPRGQQPLMRIERFVQTGSVREGEPLTLELTLSPMRFGAEERVITIDFSLPEIGLRREVFGARQETFLMSWTPAVGDLSEAERTAGELHIPVTAIVTYDEGETSVRLSRTLDVRVKLDTTRLRRRVDSKLDLLMGKVPKGLQ